MSRAKGREFVTREGWVIKSLFWHRSQKIEKKIRKKDNNKIHLLKKSFIVDNPTKLLKKLKHYDHFTPNI